MGGLGASMGRRSTEGRLGPAAGAVVTTLPSLHCSFLFVHCCTYSPFSKSHGDLCRDSPAPNPPPPRLPGPVWHFRAAGGGGKGCSRKGHPGTRGTGGGLGSRMAQFLQRGEG